MYQHNLILISSFLSALLMFILILIQPSLTQAKTRVTELSSFFKHISEPTLRPEAQIQLLSQNTSVKLTKESKQKVDFSNLHKITFDISMISSEGLIGNSDSLRSLSYQFCIPKNQKSLARIKQIDPEISCSSSKGRIDCKENQYLCIGETYKPNWQEILIAIANLDYVERIDQFFAE